MKAIELSEYCGIDCLKIIDVEKPKPVSKRNLAEGQSGGDQLCGNGADEGQIQDP